MPILTLAVEFGFVALLSTSATSTNHTPQHCRMQGPAATPNGAFKQHFIQQGTFLHCTVWWFYFMFFCFSRALFLYVGTLLTWLPKTVTRLIKPTYLYVCWYILYVGMDIYCMLGWIYVNVYCLCSLICILLNDSMQGMSRSTKMVAFWPAIKNIFTN